MEEQNSFLRSIAKFILLCGLCLIFIGVFVSRKDTIVAFINAYLFGNDTEIVIEEKNEYYRDYDFMYVQNVDHITPKSYQDLLNIYYTVLNSGQTSFSFYCPKEYKNCIEDVKEIAKEENILSTINNYVHPFNSFSFIKTEYDSLRKVIIHIEKTYNNEDIQLINKKIDELYPKLVSNNADVKDNIKSVHDYIIEHAKYDSRRSNHNVINYKSDTAYGPLFEGYALCGGYTDLMQLFLERMGVKSFRISSEKHIWNVVNIEDKWYHLDLTWDDPVVSDGRDYLEHTFFLVDTNTLLEEGRVEHAFTYNFYPEVKKEA